MKKKICFLFLSVFICPSLILLGQVKKDTEPPVAPVLELVSVNMLKGIIEISWDKSPSTDVCGYVVYKYIDNEGHSIDTIYDAAAESYNKVSSTGSTYESLSYVVAAFDSTGNISPLSNSLNTIYNNAAIDSCDRKIDLKWTAYKSSPKKVLSYSVLCSENGSSQKELAVIDSATFNYTITEYTAETIYHYTIAANLCDGNRSFSNTISVKTNFETPPSWINADYASVNENGHIDLSFSYDPESEINVFLIEKKTNDSETFQPVASLHPQGTNIIEYTDMDADTRIVNFYRMSAINNCNRPITQSNMASNIVLSANYDSNNDIELKWNSYYQWNGDIDEYQIFIDRGNGFDDLEYITTNDTVILIRYSDIMEDLSGEEIRFKVKAVEKSNPYGMNSISYSQTASVRVTEKIVVPNVFTPDGNTINDYFRPVLSFTPAQYHLSITDMRRKTVFDSSSYLESWDGTSKGRPLPEGVYLWFLKVDTPSGKTIAKTGTVTIVFNP